MELLLLVVVAAGLWVVYRNVRSEQTRERARLRIEWPGVLALTPEGRDVYATVVLQALSEDAEPDVAEVAAQIERADDEAFEQSASAETQLHHATYMTAFYQRAAIAAVLRADPYRADEGSIVDALMGELEEAAALPTRRRSLARRAMAKLVEASLTAGRAHGDVQLRRGLVALEALLDDLERNARPASW